MNRSSALVICLAASGAALAANRPACEGLGAAQLFKAATITSARPVAADSASGVLAHCEIIGYIAPVAGSRIGVVYRLPDAWNEKLIGLGGAGWAGNLRLDSAIPPLARGYATAQTDAGHAGTGLWDTDWSAKPQAVTDFAYRAVHEMTVLGKALIARYYGRVESHAYFQGCSTGGRQGLMEVQRYPADYDGVIAGAPVPTLLTQVTTLQRNLTLAAPGAGLGPEQIAKLHAAAIAACDAQDGLVDGIITDPRSCTFDPGTVACDSAAPSSGCLAPAQVTAARTLYDGIRTADGRMAAYPLMRGSEMSWSPFIKVVPEADPGAGASGANISGMRALIFGNRNFDLFGFNPEKYLALVRSTPFAKAYEAASPDVAAFVDRGGKLIVWQGFDDSGPSPIESIEYFEAVQQSLGPKVSTLSSPVRLFLAPGVEHCRGGPGADLFDPLRALEDWVERKSAPESMNATRTDGRISRPLCRYPGLPRYKGAGDPNDAASFNCS
ncbi:MAG: tannase/feruloyl esterase family alpha/beta hydrolase [Steroidobacteraceae bacterium]